MRGPDAGRVTLAGVDADRLTVAAWFEEWIAGQRSQLAAATWRGYRGALDRYLLPALGDLALAELHARHLNALYQRMTVEPGVRGRPLGLASVRYVHAVAHKALRDAARLDLILANPADKATVPKRAQSGAGPREVASWTAEELRAFLRFAAGDPLAALWHLAAATGMRRGELLGLRWSDVELARRTLTVRRALSVVDGSAELKTPKGGRTRTLRIDEVTAGVLATHHQQPASVQRHGAWDLVFTDGNGGHLDPLAVTGAFRKLVRRSGLPALSLHGLRHTHATLCLGSGVPVKVVSERLGHTQISLTLDVYAHVLPAMDADAAERFAAAVLR